MIDLSFTQDSQWVKKREEVWVQIEEDLSDEYRKKELEEIKSYFFTGKLPSHYKLSDRAKFIYFPVQSPQGWDYVFECLVQDPGHFKEELYKCASWAPRHIWSLEQEILLWDYLLGDGLYQESIKSRVPVGKNQEYVEVKIHHAKLLSIIMANLNTWVDDTEDEAYGGEPKWVRKKDYFFSMLKGVEDQYFLTENKRSEEARAGRILTRLMGKAANSLAGHSYERHRNDFLQLFANKLNIMDDLSAELKVRWHQAKSEHGVA